MTASSATALSSGMTRKLERNALVALAASGDAPGDFYAGKLAACRYFYRYEVRKTKASLEHLALLDDSIASVRTEMF